MQENIWSKVSAAGLQISIIAGSFYSWLFGAFGPLMQTVVAFMAADVITGYIKGRFFGKKTGDSKKMYIGLLKKGSMLFFVIVAHRLDQLLVMDTLLRNSVLLYIIAMEGMSILENLDEIGLKVPMLNKILKNLKDKEGDGE